MNGQQTMGATKDLERSHAYTAEHAAGDDHLFVAVAKTGHPNAFGELYQRHRLKIYHIALRILRNKQDAEDAAQRSFHRAFTNLSRLREDSTFSTWLTRITINEALMMLRQRRTNVRIFEGNGDGDYGSSAFDVPDKGPTPEEALAEHEVRAAVTQAISHLRKTLRTVVLLRDLQGLTSAETARRLGLSLAAVKTRIFNARRHLRRALRTQIQRSSCELLDRGARLENAGCDDRHEIPRHNRPGCRSSKMSSRIKNQASGREFLI